MSDARSLLRQQRAARRINHPHAAYSGTGKLLCSLCREQIKSESLWDAHIQGEPHRRRTQQQQVRDNGGEPAAAVTSQKRKHDDADEMDHDSGEGDDHEPSRKRSRAQDGTSTTADGRDISTRDDKDQRTRTPPPPLSRRSSQTPSQGVELQIPSRPATPRDSNNASSSSSSASTTTLPSRQLVPGPPIPTTTAAQQPEKKNPEGETSSKQQQQVDEDEWAAFEADIAAATFITAYDDATISAPAMTAEESARRKAEGEQDDDPRQRTSKPEADLADEREDAARALEDEMDEMRGLEAKVLRLKERRDALRQRAASHGQEGSGEGAKAAAVAELGKENAAASSVAVVEEEDEAESDDDDDEDDWDGFRFRSGLSR